MNKFTKRLIAVILSACLVTLNLNTLDISAATKKTPTKITLNKTTAVVNVKGSVTLSVKTVKPDKADKTVTWKTSNKKIATVTSKGVVKGIKAGTVTITATSKKSSKVVAKCKVTVISPSIKLNTKTLNLHTVGVKSKGTLKATVKGSSKTVYWTSSNKKVATVDKYGVVTAKKSGTVTITATANGKKTTCKVKISVPTIAISKSSASIYSAGKGNTVTLKAYYKGKSKSASWSTSSKSVATVSSKGVVTGKKAGKATITAKIGKYKITCKVTVKTQSLSLSKSAVTITVGKTTQLTAKVYGASKTVTWTSSNKSVATVTSKGLVKGIKAGKATITAKANGLTKTCVVTVKAVPTPTNKPTNKPTTPPTPPVDDDKTITIDKAGSYDVSYDGSAGYKPINKTLTQDIIKEYKDLYFDKVVDFLNNSKGNLIEGWKNAADFTKTIGSITISVAKVDDATKKITLTTATGTQVITAKVTETDVKNKFNISLTKGSKTVIFDNVTFTVGASDYTVTLTKRSITYSFVVAANGKSATLKCGKDIVATYTENDKSYVFKYDIALLNGFTVNVTAALGVEDLKLGDILNKSTFKKK